MKNKTITFINATMLLLVAWLFVLSCGRPSEVLTENGVSLRLAQLRKAQLSEVVYDIDFTVPDSINQSLKGRLLLSFVYEDVHNAPFILDFTSQEIDSLALNGKKVEYLLKNEHIIIPSYQLSKGANQIYVEFVPTDQSLNRRDEFLYTLLVPDRARTLFPCFDQPNIKARYTLSLTVPKQWTALTNAPLKQMYSFDDFDKYYFLQTEPISTYVFSFVAGKFSAVKMEKSGRSITMYHRETDKAKIAQCADILSIAFETMRYMEQYTSISYPFAKYDFVAIPAFQYGGMEHVGATLYNDGLVFFGFKCRNQGT